MTSSTILNLLRSVFLGLSLACAATATVWHHYPDVVRRFDESIVNGHVVSASDVLSEAEDLLHAGERDGALSLFEDLARSLRDAKPGDRLFRPRKTAIEEAARLLIGSEENQLALEWCDELHEIDPRDMLNGLRRVRLMRICGRAEEGRARLAEITRVAKGDWRIQADLISTLLDYGEAETVLRALLARRSLGFQAVSRRRWEIFLPSAEGRWVTQPALEVVERPDGQGVRITCRLPEPLAPPQVRLDLPSGSTLLLEDVTLRARGTGGAETILAAPYDAKTNQLLRDERGWRSENATDAYIVLETDFEAGSTPVEELAFDLTMKIQLPAAAAAALRAWDWDAGRDALIEEFGAERVARLEEMIDG